MRSEQVHRRSGSVLIGWLGMLFLAACGTPEQAPAPIEGNVVPGEAPTEFPMIADDLKHDTLLIQVTFDLGDGTRVMVAGNVEDTFEGLRLYHYRPRPDSSAEVLAYSPPAYDSWTMLPTFFRSKDMPQGTYWVLANFGEKESWGQKVMWLDGQFADRGFMDVALPERVLVDDTLRLKRANIAPFVRFEQRGDTSTFRFACDSVYVYDDQAGGHDVVISGSRVRYTWHPSTGLVLSIDGRNGTAVPYVKARTTATVSSILFGPRPWIVPILPVSGC